MPDKQPHIKPEALAALIRQYLAGELNDKAMHDLERQALDDPFLADALEGYAGHPPDQQAHQADLAARLQARITPQRNKVRALYYRWAAAAAILLLLFSGGWFLWQQQRSAPPIAGIPAPASISPQAPAPVTPDASAPAAREAVPANSVDVPAKKVTPQEAAPANSADVRAKKVTPRAAVPSKRPAAAGNKAAESAAAKPAIQPATVPAPVIEAERPEKPLTAMVPVPAASPEKAKQRAFAPASKSDSQPNGLNEVVVVGYGVQKRQNATGSVSTVRIRGTATTPGADSTRVEDALAGRVAGLNADKNNVLEEAYRAPSPLTGETAFENYLRTKTVNPGQYNGTVRVSFTVMPDGTLQGFKVIRHLNEACDAEAIRVIREGPAWTPASDGKPAKVKVRVKFTVKKD